MKKISTEDAIGHVLCHDMTRIIDGRKSEVAFKKGHIVKEEDVEALLSMGKKHIYVWKNDEGMLHENEAAEELFTICANKYIERSPVKEGKIELIAGCDGILKINKEKLHAINSIDDIIISTRHSDFPVKRGDVLAGTRVIPLIISENKIRQAQEIEKEKILFEILPIKNKKVGIITTGSEVFEGKIKDAFGPVLYEKCKEYDVEIIGQVIIDDQPEGISEAIINFIHQGADMVLCTGGMSVDPDDTTPSAIGMTGAKIITYGAPVLPGAMFLLAYYKNIIPILGLPGCVMYRERTVFDLVFPRLLAGEKLVKEDFVSYGHGGLCLKCEVCVFPNCGFGK